MFCCCICLCVTKCEASVFVSRCASLLYVPWVTSIFISPYIFSSSGYKANSQNNSTAERWNNTSAAPALRSCGSRLPASRRRPHSAFVPLSPSALFLPSFILVPSFSLSPALLEFFPPRRVRLHAPGCDVVLHSFSSICFHAPDFQPLPSPNKNNPVNTLCTWIRAIKFSAPRLFGEQSTMLILNRASSLTSIGADKNTVTWCRKLLC